MFNFLVFWTAMMFLFEGIWGLTWWIRPPRKINKIYGYRTNMSMKNKDTWDYAHRFYGKWAFSTESIIFIMTIGMILILKKHLLMEN
jgi:uncharacterized membrane protein